MYGKDVHLFFELKSVIVEYHVFTTFLSSKLLLNIIIDLNQFM